MNALSIAAYVGLVLLGFILYAIVSHFTKGSVVVQKVEAAVEADEMMIVLKLLDAMADNTADVKKIADAQANIQARAQRVAQIKAKAATLS